MPVSAHDIDQAIDTELGAARELLELLKDEQRLLIAVNTDALINVTEQKTASVSRMSEASSRRANVFAAHDIANDAAAIQAWLARAEVKTANTWTALMTVAAEAKELNHTNGLLIARHITSSQNALQVLRSNTNAGRFYGPDGHATAGNSGRTFAVG